MSSPLPGPFMVKIPWPKHLPPAEDNPLNRKRKPQREDNSQTTAAQPDTKKTKSSPPGKPRKSRDPRTPANRNPPIETSLVARRVVVAQVKALPEPEVAVGPLQEEKDSEKTSPTVQPFGPVTKGRRSQLKQEGSGRLFRTKERKGVAPQGPEAEETVCVKSVVPPPETEQTPEAPRKEDLERVVDHVQKQDKNEIFKDPVTEDVAPNYFSVISKPMDFTTVRENLAAGKYVKWQLLEEDMMTMFQNAMTYNSPSTTFHKQAKTLMQVAKKLITLGKEGVTNFRGKTAGVVRAHNAQVAADDRAEKNAQKAAIRAQKMQMRNDKLIQKAAARGIRIPFGPSSSAPALGCDGSDGKPFPGPSLRENDGRRPLPVEENVRWTYRSLVPHQYPVRHWGALASGANAEGLPFAASKMIVSTFASGPVPPDAYVQSMLRFAKKIDGRARNYLLMSAAECLP